MSARYSFGWSDPRGTFHIGGGDTYLLHEYSATAHEFEFDSDEVEIINEDSDEGQVYDGGTDADRCIGELGVRVSADKARGFGSKLRQWFSNAKTNRKNT